MNQLIGKYEIQHQVPKEKVETDLSSGDQVKLNEQQQSDRVDFTSAQIINQNPLDPTVVEAMMTGTIRDKQILLLAESEMGKFVSSNLQRQPLSSSFSNSLNSYQRMLVHRLGDSFGIKRLVESNQIFVEKTPTSAWPTVRLESLIVRLDASPSNTDNNLTSTNSSSALSISTNSSDRVEPSSSSSPTFPTSNSSNPSTGQPKTFKIMSRILSQSSRPANRNLLPSSTSPGSSTDGSLSESRRNELSYEERQAAYLEARNRIFANSNSASIENSAGDSTAGSTSSSAAGPEEDRTSATTNNSKSKSPSEAPSINSGIGNETRNHSSNTKHNSDSTRSNKTLAQLRPSATSFDPNAKAHGYEEVTIIEVDNQSITLPYQTSNSFYQNYLAHPTAEHLIPFSSDPRLTHVPPDPYKIFQHPPFPLTGSVPTSHPTYPAPPNHMSGMGPPFPIHMAPPAGMTPPPPFTQLSYQTGGESNNPAMPVIMGTVPTPPVPQSQPNDDHMLPPDHKFCLNNNQPPVFNDCHTHESVYNPTLHPIRPHQSHPPIADSSSHQHLVPVPSQFSSPLPPPSQHHHHHQQQQQNHIPFNGPPPNGVGPGFKNFPPPPFPPHDTQHPQHHSNLNMGSGYPRLGVPHMEMSNHPPAPNGFTTWSTSMPPPPPSTFYFHPTPPPPHHHPIEKSSITSTHVSDCNENGTSDLRGVSLNQDPMSTTITTTLMEAMPTKEEIVLSSPISQSPCGPSISPSCSPTVNPSSCLFNAPIITSKLNPQHNGTHIDQASMNIRTLNKAIDHLNLNHHPTHPSNNGRNYTAGKNPNKNRRTHDQNGKEGLGANRFHHRPSNTDTANPTQNQNYSSSLLHHPLPPKPVWNLKHQQNQQQLGVSTAFDSTMDTNNNSKSNHTNNSNNINLIL